MCCGDSWGMTEMSQEGDQMPTHDARVAFNRPARLRQRRSWPSGQTGFRGAAANGSGRAAPDWPPPRPVGRRSESTSAASVAGAVDAGVSRGTGNRRGCDDAVGRIGDPLLDRLAMRALPGVEPLLGAARLGSQSVAPPIGYRVGNVSRTQPPSVRRTAAWYVMLAAVSGRGRSRLTATQPHGSSSRTPSAKMPSW